MIKIRVIKWLNGLLENNLKDNQHILSQFVDVLIYRQIIETNDTNLTNILVENDKVLSIDENFGTNFDITIIFSHHQKKTLTDILDNYIKTNKNSILSKLENWKHIINSSECKENMSYYKIYDSNKWNYRLNTNIDALKGIINDNIYTFK